MVPRFSLARPTTLAEALAIHAEREGDAAYYAGGTELLQVMKMGFAQFGMLIDLKRIPELAGMVIEDDGGLRIGATVTHREIERSELVRRHLPALADLETRVANVRVRNTGTLGGNLCFAEPHSDPAALLLACGASVELEGAGGRRTLSIDEFVLGPLFTAREPDEIMLGVRIPARAAGEGRAYDKIAFFERPAASVAARVTVADGAIGDATVAVGSLTETPQLVPDAGAALVGLPLGAVAAASDTGSSPSPTELPPLPPPVLQALGALDAVDDINGSADYKRHLAAVLLARALRTAVAEALADA